MMNDRYIVVIIAALFDMRRVLMAREYNEFNERRWNKGLKS